MENETSQSENINPEENSHQDEVPAWLQGVDQPGLEDTTPNELAEHGEDAWVKENMQTDSETNAEETQSSKKSLPDWLSQLSDIDEENQNKTGISEESSNEPLEDIDFPDDLSIQSETTDKFEINAENQDSIEENQSVVTTDGEENEGFIEISELDLAENPEPLLSSEDTDISEDEDLPPWLDEMIAEPAEINVGHRQNETEPDKKQGEPTEPFDVSPEIESFEERSAESSHESIREIEEDANERTRGDTLSPIEGDTEPVTLSPSLGETTDFDQEEQVINQDQSYDLPKTLMFAKHLLDQSEFEPAKKILQTYIDQSKYVEEISQWLGEIVEQNDETHSDVWEMLGDIALQINDPNEALAAYSKAISLLLSERKTNHEAN